MPPISLPELKTEKEIKQEKRLASTKKWRVVILVARIALALIYLLIAFFNIFHRNTDAGYLDLTKRDQQQHYLAAHTYDAPVPGDTCDKQGAYWGGDSTNTATCQTDGLLMTQTNTQYLDEMRFYFVGFFTKDALDSFFPKTYQIGVHVNIVDTNGNTCAGLSVHITPTGSGGQVILVCANGFWEIYRLSSEGNFDRIIRQGILPKTQIPLTDFSIRMDVAGGTMSLYLNEKFLETALDQTFLATSQLALVVYGKDTNGATSPSVRFSQFHYAPQVDDAQTLETTFAAAQSAQQQELSQPYKAAKPGICDPTWWAPATVDNGPYATFACVDTGFQMTRHEEAPALTEDTFYYHNSLFTNDLRMSVKIDLSAANGGCAGYLTRIQGFRGYGYFVCADGRWEIDWFRPDNGHSLQIAHGSGTPCTVCSLSSTDIGTQHTIFIGGKQVGTVQDADYLTTGAVALAAYSPTDVETPIIFSDFALTPL
jgi:hypothetical protein